MRCGHEKFNLSSTDPLNVVTNTKALALLENHGRLANEPIPNTVIFWEPPGLVVKYIGNYTQLSYIAIFCWDCWGF